MALHVTADDRAIQNIESPGIAGRRSTRQRYISAICYLLFVISFEPWARMKLLGGVEIFLRLIPVNDIPPGFEIIRSPVLVEQIIGVFPNVDPDHWLQPFRDWSVLVLSLIHI